MEYPTYKFIASLPKNYTHSERRDSPVVIAVQEKEEKKEYQIGLNDLVIFFKDKKLIREKTAEDILKINDIRNTFHFNKSRTKKCDLAHVEEALKLLVHTIENAPLAMKVK
jgi:hypothetical protein